MRLWAVRCMDCGDDASDGHVYGTKMKCKLCHSSYRPWQCDFQTFALGSTSHPYELQSNLLKAITTVGDIKGDTRSLNSSSCISHCQVLQGHCTWMGQDGAFHPDPVDCCQQKFWRSWPAA